jgi:hypothetical protein
MLAHVGCQQNGAVFKAIVPGDGSAVGLVYLDGVALLVGLGVSVAFPQL